MTPRGGNALKDRLDERQEYLSKLRPMTNGLFNAAHAITGNCELAEYVLQEAILEAYLKRHKWWERMGFREGLMRTVRMRALDELSVQEEVEADWRGFPKDADRPVIALLAEAPVELQRAVMMRLGCGLTTRQVADILNQPQGALQEEIQRFLFRAERNLRAERTRPVEREVAVEIRRYMDRPGSAAFDPGSMMRAFEQDVEQRRPRRYVLRTATRLLFMGIGIVLCIVLFWVLAILVEG